jgi:hypothetical protein
MRANVLSLAVLSTSVWTHIYTAGLAGDTGKQHRDQVASDLWDQTHDAAAGNAVAFSIFSRLVRGMPADIIWRAFVAPRLSSQRLTVNLEESRVMSMSMKLSFLPPPPSSRGWLRWLSFLHLCPIRWPTRAPALPLSP